MITPQKHLAILNKNYEKHDDTYPDVELLFYFALI